ncbi:unnamed protein product [Acanthoscelides obtectus]|uniref:Uncharacterized protein n=1 Tax=Acanthoscelides obtectus TaxID=200917 RepID=A0A9P0PQV6_ACAOB|nr:unnamed protein product [Acanthoscelides obtectus]CAK1656575.1 hypothetical protein AOBTE_LOCUS19810 [Acanthoscelides obtectus]
MTSSLTRDLEAITAWGRNNLVQFNASKTQYCTLTNKKRLCARSVSMDGRVLPKSHSFRLVGVQITEDLIWHENISSIAVAAGKKLGYLFRAKKYFSPHDLLTLLGTLSHRRAVGDLALFYRYTNGLCSSDLSSMMPPRDVPARQTRLTLATGRYDRSFVPRVSRLWNNLQEEAFLSSINLRQFKNRTNKISLG